MQKDERSHYARSVARHRRSEGENVSGALILRAESFRKFQIAFDRVSAMIDARDLVVKEAGAFACVAHAKNFMCATDARDECTAQQSLKIERDIGLQLSRLLHPAQQIERDTESATQFVARKNVNVIDVAIAAQQRRPLRINHPVIRALD